MSDDKLSPREHDDMRDLILAGAHRIRRAGAHRVQFIAGAVALALVAGITGGAIATASMLGAGPVPPAVTSTPIVRAGAPVAAFDDECANALTAADIERLVGEDLTPNARYEGIPGNTRMAGGIECLWGSEDDDHLPLLYVFAAPESSAPDRPAYPAGCRPVNGGGVVSCTTRGVVDGTLLLVSVTAAGGGIEASRVDTLFEEVAGHLSEYAAPRAATPTAQWWGPMDCAAILTGVDPTEVGFDRVEPVESVEDTFCYATLTSGSDDDARSEVVLLSIVPGAGPYFSTALDSPGAEPVTVPGAQGAVILRTGDPANQTEHLVITDGVNILSVSPAGGLDVADLIPFASVFLAEMHP